MIESIKTPMESGNERDLKSSFGKTGYKMLKNVILGKLTENSVKATNEAIQSGTFPNMADAAANSLRDAQRYQAALDVLKEIEEMEKYDLVSTKVS